MKVLILLLASMAIVCALTLTVSHLFIRSESVGMAFGVVAGAILTPIVFLAIDKWTE